MAGELLNDDMGHFVRWTGGGKTRETLRTKDRKKAEMWLVAGNCHGASDHDKACPFCSSQLQAIKEGW